MKFNPFSNFARVSTTLHRTAITITCVFAMQPVMADNTWDGGGSPSTLWGTSANWGLDTAPTYSSGLIFAGTTGLFSDNDVTNRTVGGFTFDVGAGSFVIGGSSLTINKAINNNSGVTQTINNTVTWSIGSSSVNNAIGGNGDVVFGGAVTSSVSGGPTFLFNNTLTSFNGGFGMTTGTGQRTNTFGGAGNVSITGLSNGNGTNSANIFNWSNSGTLTLNGSSIWGSVNLNAGTTLLTDGYSSTSAKNGAFTVGSGAIPVTSVASPVGINTGNATLKIVGNQNLGTAGIGNTTLTVRGGNTGGSPIGQGTLSLVDSSLNTLTINNATAGSTLLTMAGGSGQSSVLNMEIGNNSADQIVLANSGKISVGAGGVALNIAGIGGFNTGAPTQSLTLVSAPGTGLAAGGSQFTLGTNTGNFGGYTTADLSSTTTTELILTLGGYTAAPTTAFWKGGINGNWSTLDGGLANNSNWTTDSGGTADAHQVVGATSDVFFSATSPSNTGTTLGQDFSIKSLTFDNDASVSGNALTVGNGTTGITVNSGITGTINSVLAGGSGVTKNGTGDLVLGGDNTFTGGLTINDGVVRLTHAGALNTSTPQAVTFGDASGKSPVLQLGGISLTTGALSAGATLNTPVFENANASGATLTVSQSTHTSYGGIIRDGAGGGALNFIKTGGGTLTLGGSNSYTGTTSVTDGTLLINGNSSSANGAVSVAGGATLGGTGISGASVTLSSGGQITGSGIGSTGTLSLSGDLMIGSGGIAYFDIVDGGAYDSLAIGGGLMLSSGAIIKVSSGLTTAASYNLFSYTGADPTLSGVTFQNLTGNALGGNYSFTATGGVLALNITSASQAAPSIDINLSTSSRVMQSTVIGVSGTIGNSGPVDLNGTLSDSGGNLTVGSFTPSSPFTVTASGGTQAYTGNTNSGTTLGNRTLGVSVSDPAASPTSVTASTSVSVLQDRVVSASTAGDFGSVHQGAAVSGTISLTSAGADDSNTRVTVANAGADANGISVSGGTHPVFDGSTSDTRTVSGNLSTLGAVNGAITLTTTGEAGVSGTQSPVNVTVNYSASVYSGKAAWTSGASGSWATGGNWADTLGGGVAGSPGVDGALSAGDTARFGDVSGSPASLTVNLDGANPSLNGITFDSTATAYTIAAGSGGSITLQGAATPIDVSTSFSPTISAGLAGAGLNKTGSGTLILSGAGSYTGATAVSNGTLQITGGNDRLPAATTLTLGSGTNSGKLVLGDSSTARNQTVAGLTTSGTGTANSVTGAAAANSTLTVNIVAGSNTFAGTLGGGGTNEDHLALVKAGAGTLVLTGSNTYTGGTTLAGGSLSLGSANAIGTSGAITFAGGTLQFSAANTSDYMSRYATTGNNAYSLDTNGQNINLAAGLVASGSSGLTKSGAGILTLAATGNTYTGATTIGGGVLVTQDATTNTLRLAGGVWQPLLTGDIAVSGTLGSSTGAAALNSWTAGGFAANGGKITVTANGGADLSWGSGGFMGSGTTPMVFGSAAANDQVEVTNNINLNTTDAFQRVFIVNQGVGGDSALLSGVLSGGTGIASATGLVKQGDGILILSGDNTYTGLTSITAGTLVAGRDSLSGGNGAFGTGTGPSGAPTSPSAIFLNATAGASPSLWIGGAFEVGRAVTINNVATSGAYEIGGSTDNSATFSGLVTTSQNLNVTQVATTGANALHITGGIATGAGAPTVDFNNAGAVHVSTGAISGALSVVQSGDGTTTFSDTHSYSGTTTVDAGTLVVNGNISTSVLTTVNDGGTLAGMGTIGAVTVEAGGTLAPGTSPGILNAGDTILHGGSILDIEINGANPGTQYDQLNVTGTVSLAGLLAITMTDFTPAMNSLFFILANDESEAISGTFSNASTQGGTYFFGGQGFQISYEGDSDSQSFSGGNDVVLMAIPEPGAALLGSLGLLRLLRRRRTK